MLSTTVSTAAFTSLSAAAIAPTSTAVATTNSLRIAAVMTGRNLSRLGRLHRVQQAQRSLQARSLQTTRLAPRAAAPATAGAFQTTAFLRSLPATATSLGSNRYLTTTLPLRKIDPAKAVPTEITEDQYHELADMYLEDILTKFEDLQDEGEDLDVEYASGVMTLRFPFGTYVLNKQPPNKQIWLSSPKSGPKRYDWVVLSEGQDAKEGTGHGEWVYTRDGTTISELFEQETGVDLTMPIAHAGG